MPSRKLIQLILSAVFPIVGLTTLPLFAQTQSSGVYIDPNRSDHRLKRTVILRGNNVELNFENWGFLGGCQIGGEPGGGIWPRGTDHDHLHSLSPFMAANPIGTKGQRVIVISHAYRPQLGPNGHNIDPLTNVEQTLQPLPGYLNNTREQPEVANELNSNSWPDSWPGKGSEWSHYWNGYFGLNQKNADQEAYFVMDDAWNNKAAFYPGHMDDPNAKDPLWRGLGLQVEVRGFQWAHSLAQNAVFAHYQVSNIGKYDYDFATQDTIYFGVFSDINAGGCGGVDDDATWDPPPANIVFAWDNDNYSGYWIKFPEILPGYMAYKYLESPGIGDDGIDNDQDGIIDERRDNDAGTKLNSADEVKAYITSHYDVQKFLSFYKYASLDELPAVMQGYGWTGDENFNWRGYDDLNHNGKWDEGEPLNDDKGTDGIGPGEEGYPGPDLDNSQGNGRPDQGEPNFGKNDKDESDQIGLTSFCAPFYDVGPNDITTENTFWPLIKHGRYVAPPASANQFWCFGSGPFRLPPGKTERYSISFLFGPDKDAIYRQADIVQIIYNAGYRFAVPPKQPVLHATAGDHKVTLTWDNSAESSFDPIYGHDFEGYKIIKSTEPQFMEPYLITDGYGNKTFKQPVAQFDLVDGLTGFHPLQLGDEIGKPQGIHYFMGTDNGLQHHWVDTNVTNGRTYYYAVLSYDKGWAPGFYERGLSEVKQPFPISPSECPASITVSGGVITHMDVNTAYAIPNPNPSNYVLGSTDAADSALHRSGFASGKVSATVLLPDSLQTRKYNITFSDSTWNVTGLKTTNYSVFDMTDGFYVRKDVPLPTKFADSLSVTKKWIDELEGQGITLNFENAVPSAAYATAFSSWQEGSTSNYTVDPSWNSSSRFGFPLPIQPINAALEFGDSTEVLDTAYTSTTFPANPRNHQPVNFKMYNLDTNEKLAMYFVKKHSTAKNQIDTGDYVQIAIPTNNMLSTTWMLTFWGPSDTTQPIIRPMKGDRYFLHTGIPFSSKDTLEFNTISSGVHKNVTSSAILDKIKVVPNPYVEASIWEQKPTFRGRGPRMINFNNVPSKCTLRIYTLNGYLVKEIRHEGGTGATGTITWDLTSNEGLEVSSGLYIYHVEADGIGTKIGKFGIVN